MLSRLLILIGMIFNAGLVAKYVQVWANPGPDQLETITTLMMLIVFEFVMVHSGVFMSVMPRKVSLFILIPFYGLFALAFNAISPGNMILWLYLGVIASRMRFAFSNPSPEATARNITFSVAAVMTYFFLIMGSVMASGLIPELGLTHDYLKSVNYGADTNAEGLFTEMPHLPMSIGTLYFSALIIIESRLYLFPRRKLTHSLIVANPMD